MSDERIPKKMMKYRSTRYRFIGYPRKGCMEMSVQNWLCVIHGGGVGGEEGCVCSGFPLMH
jgi:hypothetical protein